MPISVFLIRHGAYEHRASPEGTEAGCDLGLFALGRRQAEALRERLACTGEIRADARDDWVQEFANDTHHLRSLAS